MDPKPDDDLLRSKYAAIKIPEVKMYRFLHIN